MTEAVKQAERQWPDNIVSGDIRYGKASNYDGFFLADADHGIPTFGSVADTSPPTIRGQHVSVFNYPGQTEAIASELVRRWNAHSDLLEALHVVGMSAGWQYMTMETRALVQAAIDKAEGRS